MLRSFIEDKPLFFFGLFALTVIQIMLSDSRIFVKKVGLKTMERQRYHCKDS